ncbi:hypothetical protein [Bosea sp. OK403]|nr:hypothetical protein [Bosea sp. OK403]
MPSADFRIPGVLNPKDVFVANAIQARAFEIRHADGRLAVGTIGAKLGGS